MDEHQVRQEIGARLRWARERRRITLVEIATQAFISPAAVSQVETGQTSPRLFTFLKMCWALGEDPCAMIADLPAAVEEFEL